MQNLKYINIDDIGDESVKLTLQFTENVATAVFNHRMSVCDVILNLRRLADGLKSIAEKGSLEEMEKLGIFKNE